MAAVDPARPESWPVLLTPEDLTVIFRFDHSDRRERTRAVYDLVRAGVLRPIGEHAKCSKTMRFSAAAVRRVAGVA